MQIFGLRKLEQRTQLAGAGGVNDDDALALFELGDDVATVNRREQQHGNGEKKQNQGSRSRCQPHGKFQPRVKEKLGLTRLFPARERRPAS